MKYLVGKLLTNVEYEPTPGKTETVKIGGCDGYLPVFNTIEEALECADDRYPISLIEPIVAPEVEA